MELDSFSVGFDSFSIEVDVISVEVDVISFEVDVIRVGADVIWVKSMGVSDTLYFDVYALQNFQTHIIQNLVERRLKGLERQYSRTCQTPLYFGRQTHGLF